jgi:uncharacterized membrane protein
MWAGEILVWIVEIFLCEGAVDEETGMNKREQRQLKRILKRRLKEAETEEDRELARAAIARLKSGEADPE